jgi:hypothetical protein
MTIDLETLEVVKPATQAEAAPEVEAPPSEFPGLATAEDGSLVPNAPPYTQAQVLEEEIRGSEIAPASSNRRKRELQFGQRSFSLRELAKADIGRPTEIVEHLLFEGDTACLVARPKTGKTRLTQQLTIALAEGPNARFLGLKILRRCRVLYLDFESHPGDALDHFRRIAGDRWDRVQDHIYVYCVRSLADSRLGLHGDGLKELRLRVQEVGPDMLIIDTWRLICAGNENEADAVVRNLRQLDELREINPYLTILLLHHLRKSGPEDQGRISLRQDPQVWLENAAGSHALIAHIDAAFGLEPEDDDVYTLAGVRRSGPAPLIVMRSDEQTLRFEPLDDLEMRAAFVFTHAQRELWTKLPKQFRWADAETIAGGASKKSLVSATLRRALVNGLLTHGHGGEYAKAEATP